MKSKISSQLFTIIVAIVILISMYIFFDSRIDRLQRAVSIEAAQKGFALSHCDKENPPFDSVKVNNDTVLFYKKSVYAGMSVIDME